MALAVGTTRRTTPPVGRGPRRRRWRLNLATVHSYGVARSALGDAETPDDVSFSEVRIGNTYFGADKDRTDTELLLAKAETLTFSLSALAGAVLQYGKQGISIVHGGLATCPDGRMILDVEPLKNVVW